MSLIGGAADCLPRRDDVHGKLQVHGDDDPPDELCFPAPGHQSQQRYSERCLGQSKGDAL